MSAQQKIDRAFPQTDAIGDGRIPPVRPFTAPAFSATVVDHPAPPGGRRSAVPHLRLVFLGQRRVPGLVAGSRIKYEGMVAPLDSVPTVFNPRYEILPERSSR